MELPVIFDNRRGTMVTVGWSSQYWCQGCSRLSAVFATVRADCAGCMMPAISDPDDNGYDVICILCGWTLLP